MYIIFIYLFFFIFIFGADFSMVEHLLVVSKSGNPGPNSYFLYYIFVKALILIKFEHNA